MHRLDLPYEVYLYKKCQSLKAKLKRMQDKPLDVDGCLRLLTASVFVPDWRRDKHMAGVQCDYYKIWSYNPAKKKQLQLQV